LNLSRPTNFAFLVILNDKQIKLEPATDIQIINTFIKGQELKDDNLALIREIARL